MGEIASWICTWAHLYLFLFLTQLQPLSVQAPAPFVRPSGCVSLFLVQSVCGQAMCILPSSSGTVNSWCEITPSPSLTHPPPRSVMKIISRSGWCKRWLQAALHHLLWSCAVFLSVSEKTGWCCLAFLRWMQDDIWKRLYWKKLMCWTVTVKLTLLFGFCNPTEN